MSEEPGSPISDISRMSEEPGSPVNDISRTTRVAFHDPATQIRLLHLDPNSTDDNISATLDVWDKDSAPSYNAISYVCGTSPARNAITVNDQTVLVRDNCFEALQQTNLHFPGCYVWVDAICINQNDLAEKSAQVAIMGKIYVKAAHVLACIGPTDSFVQSIRALDGKAIVQGVTEHEDYQVERTTMSYKWYPDGLTCPETRFPATEDDEAIVKSLLAGWNLLSLRPYFKRAWVVQELIGGKDRTIVLCGRDKLDLTLLRVVGGRLHGVNLDPLTNMNRYRIDVNIFGLVDMVNNAGAGGHFTQYLEETWVLDCEDPRDRVFSVLSLVDWDLHGQTPILPDYSMTSFQLAFQLMSRLVDLDFAHVLIIIAALNLDEQYSVDMHSEVLGRYKSDERSTTRQEWTEDVNSAYFILQDSVGRLQLDLPSSKERREVDDKSRYRLPNYDYKYLATKGILPVFAYGDVVALVRGPIRRGDILLVGESFNLVLRACSDASTFGIVGAAWTLKPFSPLLTGACKCWQADVDEERFRRVRIGLAVTREEAFEDQLARIVTLNKSSDCTSVVSYLIHHAIGSTQKGAFVQDVTTRRWQDQEVIGPMHPMCSAHGAHLASKLHRVLRNPVWFTLLSSSKKFVRTCKPTTSRAASTSSSKRVTEEE